jgi:hypothetical protein
MEIKPMKEELEKAIKTLAEKITKDLGPNDSMKYTQATLNLTHALEKVTLLDRSPSRGVPRA